MTRELVKRVDDFVERNLPWWELDDIEDKSLTTCLGTTAKRVLETLDTWLDEDEALKAELEEESRKEDFYEIRFRFWLIDNDVDTEKDNTLQNLIDHVCKIDREHFDEFYTDLDCDCYMASGKGFKKAMSSEIFGAEEYEKVKDLTDDIIYIEDCRTEPSTWHIIGKISR